MTGDTSKLVSQSEIKAWNRCRRRYYLAYVRRLRKFSLEPNALTVGQMVHTGWEHIDGDWAGEIETLHNTYRETVPELLHPELQNQLELALIMVEGLAEWAAETGINHGVELLQREAEIAVDFGTYTIMGKLDELVRHPAGHTGLRDLKTGANFRLFELADIDLQFRTYIMMLQAIYGDDAPMMAEWVVARKVKRTASAKPPFYAKKEIVYNQQTIDATRRFWASSMHQVLHYLELHEAGSYEHIDELFPPSPSYDCGRCPFRDACPMMDDGSDYEGFLDAAYVVSDPNERYKDVKVLATVETPVPWTN